MKKLALLATALLLAVGGCGNIPPRSVTSTTAGGNWEAQLTGGTGQASLLNFVVSFTVTNTGPLDITGFAFLNSGACFATGLNAATETGKATLNTVSSGFVTGSLDLTITSNNPPGNVLTLTTLDGGLTGNSNGTTSTTGTLSNGVAIGTWQITGGKGDSSCDNQGGTFIMCQDKTTCSPP